MKRLTLTVVTIIALITTVVAIPSAEASHLEGTTCFSPFSGVPSTIPGVDSVSSSDTYDIYYEIVSGSYTVNVRSLTGTVRLDVYEATSDADCGPWVKGTTVTLSNTRSVTVGSGTYYFTVEYVSSLPFTQAWYTINS